MKKFFIYKIIPHSQINELLKIEPKLKSMIDWTKPFTVRIMPDHYQCFIHSVISQQLNSAAVDSIWNKFSLFFKKINPKTISMVTNEQLNALGLSPQKISLIKKFTYDIIDNKISLKKIEKYSNEKIKQLLTQYKYLGDWTVDMLLMFTYYRNDILPISDYGIRMGLMKLYNINRVNDESLKYLTKKFGSLLTIFSFCLWRINQNI